MRDVLTAEALRERAREWIDVLWVRGDADAVARLHTPGFVDRSSSGRTADNAGFAAAIRELFRSFPDVRTNIEDLVVDAPAQKVAVRWSARGTHRGPYLGSAATGKSVDFRGIEVLRFEGALVAERWGEWDGLDLVEQLRG